MSRRVSTRNASLQQWQAYLTNRGKRNRDGRFLVQGVRPITLAVEHRWPLETLIYRLGEPELSGWARQLLESAGVPTVGLLAELMDELGEKSSGVPELVAVACSRKSELAEFTVRRGSPVVVVVDRPGSPGNLGTLIRSADAFGAAAVVVTGHGADQYDPRCVRASTGSLFAMPVFRVPDPTHVVAFRDRHAALGIPMSIVGTDEDGQSALYDHPFAGGTILVIGNESRGMSAAWRQVCDATVHIPVGGAASSLGAPSAAAVALYEIAARQARGPR
ncbi:TrmH family RNA methyltransferase [Skermania piniformis]|uniref:RNA methyltransferase n=1 Tax=Skermania pinensis TaxID=39122 RepID=A0ABX8SDY4_9ACTN|nr:TrmH family RNA methyltransferase [Skermania piniformis]QXQ15169.1 RNA methyltransferase [Skermania piniformis]